MPPAKPAKQKLLDKLVVKGGSGTDADVAAVRAQVGLLSEPILAFFKKKKLKVVACRESVTDFETSLRGQLPRGWDPRAGKTWDDVPGAYLIGRKKIVIATVAGPGGREVPAPGNKHGSCNLAVHEAMHGHDIAGEGRLTASPAFVAAREADLAKLPEYEQQAGKAGVEETYAESAARHYSRQPGFASALPNLAGYWSSGPAERMGTAAARAGLSQDAGEADAVDDEDAPIGTATLEADGSLFLDLRAHEPGVAIGHAAFRAAPEAAGYDVQAGFQADAGEAVPTTALVRPWRGG
jgi:hypothetical protein